MVNAAAHSARWANALTESVDAAVDLYADAFTFDDHADADHVYDTPITKDELRPFLAPYSNKDAENGTGVHSFEVRESFELTATDGSKAVITLWTWTGTNLESYLGLPAEGKTLSALGQTWHVLDSDGKIVRESTFWNDPPALAELGVPVSTPHYWEKDFVLG